jgi:hypothetical protein
MSSPPTRTSILLGCLAAWLCALAAPATAQASSTQVTILQDDPKIVFAGDAGQLDRTLTRVKALGVDTIRVSVFWHLVAPNARSKSRPDFGDNGAAWPGSYPQSSWDRYDRIVTLAQKHGLDVLLSVTGPAPAWASATHLRHESALQPDPKDFGDFMQAVGTRYSGLYSPDSDDRTKQGGPMFRQPSPAQPALPRVSTWSIWNEPNFPAWLYPQWKRTHGRPVPASPRQYRRLVDAAWHGLQASGHPSDTVLLGETAPYGPSNPNRPKLNGLVSPLVFLRDVYCVNRSFRPYRGAAARTRGCPTTSESRATFAQRNPGLFQATGWAHHAYSIRRPPPFKGKRPEVAPLGATDKLLSTLDRAQFAWGTTGGWPVWITEYGYETFPPDPFRGVSWRRQASWMSWAEYLAYANARVGAFDQFLLVDDAPRRGFGARDPRRWVTWQSGFITTGGRVKPAYEEFKRPIFVSPRRTRPGGAVRVFGAYRVADTGVPLQARIEFGAGGEWQTLESLTVTDERGYLVTSVNPPGRGALRIVWTDPGTGREKASRAVGLTVRR